MSLSARRAWIEIAVLELIPLTDPSLSARRAWIEMREVKAGILLDLTSLSARRAWIEIGRNTALHRQCQVALRKESVDRNCVISKLKPSSRVALRKESVDRNLLASPFNIIFGVSLSARRAWIEIVQVCASCMYNSVALRKESVDRNRSGRIRL